MKYTFLYTISHAETPCDDEKEFTVEAENETDARNKFDEECSEHLLQGYSIELITMDVTPSDVLDVLKEKEEEFQQAIENFGEPVQPTSLKDINDEVSNVDTHNKEEVKKVLDEHSLALYSFTFMVIKGIDTMDSYIDVTEVEAKTEKEAFLIACEQVMISCPEKRKIWYKGKPLEHYGYVPKTIPQDGKK